MIFSVDDCYQTEAPFQIFWFVANSSIIVVLTILIKTRAKDYDQRNDLSVKLFGTSLNLNLHKILNLKTAVIEYFFKEAITTILLTGILSLLLFFLMKRFKCAQPKSPPN